MKSYLFIRLAGTLLAASLAAGSASAQTPYIDLCKEQNVPIPPPLKIPANAADWFDLEKTNSWVFQGALETKLIESAIFAGVWTYSHPSLQGACIALPRGTGTPGSEDVAGIICQSATTGRACFWDNRKATDPDQIPIGWRDVLLDISKLHDGTSLEQNCTRCHRGNNVFPISPDDPTWAKVLRGPLNGPSTENFTTQVEASSDIKPDDPNDPDSPLHPRYIPIAPQPGWENPFPPAGPNCGKSCHEVPAVGFTPFPPMAPACAGLTQDEELCYKDVVPAAGSLEFSAGDYPVSEDAGSVVITVTRVGGSTSKVSANFTTADGTATDGTDYSFTDGLLTWADGDTADKTFSVPITNDPDVEDAETVNLSLSKHLGPSNNPCNPSDPSNPPACDGATVGPRSTATITIAPEAGSLQFSVADYQVSEGDGSAIITVTRIGGSNGQVSVNFTTVVGPGAGTATDGADYAFTDGSLTWADGDTADKTFTVPIIDDTDVEEDETVNLSLSNPNGGALLGTPATAVLKITDNEPGGVPRCAGLTPTIVGTAGNDLLTGTARPDVIHGRGGDDTITGLGGNDTICGGSGSDRLFGARGTDRLFGGNGKDRLFGERGADFLFGERDNDALNGGRASDSCNGGRGENTAVRCERVVHVPKSQAHVKSSGSASPDGKPAVFHCSGSSGGCTAAFDLQSSRRDKCRQVST